MLNSKLKSMKKINEIGFNLFDNKLKVSFWIFIHFFFLLKKLFFSELADEDLGEDDVFVLESIAEAQKNEDDKLRVTLVLSLKESLPALAKVIKIIEVRDLKE